MKFQRQAEKKHTHAFIFIYHRCLINYRFDIRKPMMFNKL